MQKKTFFIILNIFITFSAFAEDKFDFLTQKYPDLIGSGAGLNSFLQLLEAYYHSRGKNMPKITFLELNYSFNQSSDIDFIKKDDFEHDVRGDKMNALKNEWRLILKAKPSRNIKEYQLRARIIPVSMSTLNMVIDFNMFQDLGLCPSWYPAYQWSAEYDVRRDKGGKYHKQIDSYFRHNIKKILQTDIYQDVLT